MIPQNTISDTALSVRPRCSIQVPRDVCIRTVCFERKDDQGYCEHDLNDAATVQSSHLTGASLCRMCAIRLNIPMLERLLLLTFIEDAEQGWRNAYTYGELARIVGRGIHSVETAVSNLRKAGFLTSSRISRSGSYVLFNIDEFLRWGESRVYGTEAPASVAEPPEMAAAPQAAERLSPPPAPAPREVKPRRTKRVKAPVAATTPTQSEPAPAVVKRAPTGETGFAVDDHPEWPAVPLDWRERNRIPKPEEDGDSWRIPYGVKPWLGPVPLIDGQYDMEKLRRKPYQLYTEEERHARCLADEPQGVPDSDGSFEGEEIDCSAEQEASNRAKAAEAKKSGADPEFDISSGTDTAESDIMVGVNHEIGV